MLIDKELTENILINPAKQGADHLKIIAGYATPQMASWHIQRLNDLYIQPVKIDLVVGMVPGEGVNLVLHKGFLDVINRYKMNEGYSSFKCQYIYKGLPVHSKLYLWEKDGILVDAFIGSANYTQNAFNSRNQRECMSRIPISEAISLYFDKVESDSIYCNSGEIEEFVKLYSTDKDNLTLAEEIAQNYNSTNRIKLSLLTSKGDKVGERSGLNWGQREKRERNQAYIPLPRKMAKSGFFPIKKNGEEKAPHFTVLTDDSKSLVLRVEQEGDKAITTPENNSRLGEYFRNRLGLPNGSPVTLEDLNRYGRTDVEFIKLDEEQYYMDFSVRK